MIDIRSDTVTHPTQEMRKAMYEAEVGDDVIGDDPTVARIQEMGAALFGKEACLITTSGTMSNQTAVLSLTNKCEQIVVHDKSHMYNLEVAALAQICGVQARPIPAPGGHYDLNEPHQARHPERPHLPGLSGEHLRPEPGSGGG